LADVARHDLTSGQRFTLQAIPSTILRLQCGHVLRLRLIGLSNALSASAALRIHSIVPSFRLRPIIAI
jgi:hypothetical protein